MRPGVSCDKIPSSPTAAHVLSLVVAFTLTLYLCVQSWDVSRDCNFSHAKTGSAEETTFVYFVPAIRLFPHNQSYRPISASLSEAADESRIAD